MSFESCVITRNSKLDTMSSHTNISEGISQNNIPAFTLIENHLSSVKELIDKQMTGPAEAGDINQLLEYVRCRNSDMIRPGLVLLAGRCCGEITEEHIQVAAIVEIIHNAMLLHDDVIGKEQKRLERFSINGLSSSETPVLLGDFLLGRVFQMCAKLKPQVNEIIAGAAVRICEGQLKQITQRRNWQLSEPEYIEVITEKSAVLFAIACRLGALMAKGDSHQIRLLAESGLNAGIAYQITDELIDLIGENGTQPSADKDIGLHSPGLVAIHLLGAVDKKDRGVVINACSGRKDLQYDKGTLAKMLKRYGSLEYVRARVQNFITNSVVALETLKESNARDALIETVKFITCRAV